MAELAPLSMLFLALLVVVPVLYFIRSSRRHEEGSSRPRPPPSPWALPVIGHLHHVAGALPHRAMLGLSRRHGPLMLLRLCELRVVVASSADAAREIMKTQDLAFASRPMTPTGTALLGDSPGIVFAPYGDAWRQLRKICTLELFTSRRVRSFRPVREEEVGRLLRSVAVAAPSSAVNLSERISAYVADSAVRAVIGSRFKDRGAFLRMLERRMKLAPAQCLPDLFPSSRLAMLVSRMPREMKRERREMRDFIDAIIQEHQENSPAGAGADDDDFLDVLLRIQGEGKLDPPLTNDDIKSTRTGHLHSEQRDVGDGAAVGHGRADEEPEGDAQGAGGGPASSRRARQGHGGEPGEPALPGPRHQGGAPAAPAGDDAAPPRVPGPVPDPRLRRAGGRHGARQRVGDRQGPGALGLVGGVLAGEVRGRWRRLQGHGLRVHTVRRRAANVPRDGVRAGQHGARARQPSLPLRLGAAGRGGARGAGHGRAAGAHHAPALRPPARPGGPRAIAKAK
uniref:Cytochrome P450 71D10 n=1 Tax=Aegilops tauschii subsp. strangulata TaxID=200361 RepID=A0A452Z1I8_AEGTS